MSERYTRKDAYKAFTRLASALGKTWSDDAGTLHKGDYWQPTDAGQLWVRDEIADDRGQHVRYENRAHVGAWTLDYNPVYGGFVVEEMHNQGGGVSRPLGDMRRNARDFCDAVRFAMDALGIRDKVTA